MRRKLPPLLPGSVASIAPVSAVTSARPASSPIQPVSDDELEGTDAPMAPAPTEYPPRTARRRRGGQPITAARARAAATDDDEVTLQQAMIREPRYEGFRIWVVGTTPLITHAWSEKARVQMLAKQVKSVSPGKEARDPEKDFLSSLYEMGRPGEYGFPATALKKAILGVAHKDKGIPRTGALSVCAALRINAKFVATRPALQGATCDMPLLRIYGSEPLMREDMVRVGAGANKKADFAYRAQFTDWAFRVTGRLNVDILSRDALAHLIKEAGFAIGVGDWRIEKVGYFGGFRLANSDEHKAWEAFAAGTGPLPETRDDDEDDFPLAAE